MENLKDTIFKFLHLDGVINHLSGYLETRIELFKIEIKEDVTKVIASSMIYAVVFFFATMFMLFFSIGLAQFLNGYFNESYPGYWVVACIYLAGFLIFMIFRNSILKKFEKQLTDIIKRREK